MPQKLKISLGQRLRTHPLPRGGSDCVQAHFVSAMVMPQKSESRLGTVSPVQAHFVSAMVMPQKSESRLGTVSRSKHISCQPWLCLKNQNLAWVQSAGPSTFRVSHGYASTIRISLGYSQPVKAHFVSARVIPKKSKSRLGTVSRSKHISCQPW